MNIPIWKSIKLVSGIASVIALVSLPFFVGCGPGRTNTMYVSQSAPNVSSPASGDESGSTTNVGSGGSGDKATWEKVANELVADLGRLVISPIDEPTFEKIKKELPDLVRKTRVEFVEYPLVLGKETCGQPSGSRFSGSKNSCELVRSQVSNGTERDAINFRDCGLIKVSHPRFRCFDETSDGIKRLVLHEYLGMMGISEKEADGETRYKLTNALIEGLKSVAKFENGLRVEMIRTCEDFDRVAVEFESHQMNGEDSDARLAYPFIIWRLAADLDCSKHVAVRKLYPAPIMRGHLDGDGHTLIPPPLLKVDIAAIPPNPYYKEPYPDYGQALFEMICARCVIANIKIKNADIYGTALLAGVNYGTITNSVIEGTLKLWPRTQYGDRATTYVGGLVTSNEGFISKVNVNIHIHDKEYDYSVLGAGFSPYVGGVVALNRGMMTDMKAQTKIEVDRSQISGFVDQNFGPVKNIDVHTDIRINNPGRYIGGFSMSDQNFEKIKVSGWIRFPDLKRPYGADVIDPDNSGRLAIVGGFTAFGNKADVVVDVNICGNITIAKSEKFPEYSLLRDPAIGNYFDLFNEGLKGTFVSTGKLYDRCTGEGDQK